MIVDLSCVVLLCVAIDTLGLFLMLQTVAICADGSFYRFMIDEQKGGECVRDSYSKFLKESDDDYIG